MAVKIQHLRSSTASKRPTTAALLDGELSINTNAGTSGVFFKDSAGTAIIKVGPAEVGSSAPNSTPGAGGSSGNSTGEFWLDTANTGGNSQRALKVYDGSAWQYVGSATIGSTNIQLGAAATTAITGLTSLGAGSLDVTTAVDLENQADLRFYEATANGTNYVGFQAPASITADVLWTLPSADGSNGQFLQTNGTGTLSWGTVSTNSISQGNTSVTVTDTGSNGTITFSTEGTTDWIINSSGHFVPGSDSTFNIGASGNEVLNVYADNLYGTIQTASQTNITGVGTLTAGTWNATTIGTAYGGTGQTTYTNGQLLIGNTTGNTLTKATLTASTGISVTNGSGSITLAVTGAVPTSVAGDSGTATPTSNSFTISGGTGLSSSAAGATVTINLDNTAVSPASYGSASSVATFTVDAQGRLTAAATTTISILHTQVSDFDAGVQTNRLDQMAAPTASVSLNSQKITNLATPTADTDAANKGYVDSVAQGIDVKASCRVATAAALPTVTYANGSLGVGATLTASATGVLTVDGVATVLGDRILVKNQASALQNGIYAVTTAGAVGTAFVLTRSTDMDVAAEIPSAFTFIEEGSTNADSGWVCTTNAPVTVGTTNITFDQFSGAGQITAGNGLSKTGNTLDVNVDSRASGTKTTAIVSDEVRIDTAWTGQTSLTTLGTVTTGTWNATAIGLAYGGTGQSNTNITSRHVFMGPAGTNGNAAFREFTTADVNPTTNGSFDAGSY